MVLVFGDNLHRRRTSAVTYVIAAACVAVTLIESILPVTTGEIDRLFAFVQSNSVCIPLHHSTPCSLPSLFTRG